MYQQNHQNLHQLKKIKTLPLLSLFTIKFILQTQNYFYLLSSTTLFIYLRYQPHLSFRFLGVYFTCVSFLHITTKLETYDYNSYFMEGRNDTILTDLDNVDAQPIPKDLTDNRFDGLSKLHIWAYGVGHFINDLVAACWFNYLFFFLKKIVKTDAASSALLAGQLCDGIATPIVGVLSDRYHTSIGQRKPWYIAGLVLVFSCFIPLFSGFSSENVSSEYAFYTIFPGMFNVGWAALQISHMSLVPALTCSRKRRDKLNNLRNFFTFISNFTVLGIGLIIFSVMGNPQLEYKLITYFSLGIGLAASIFFIININEPQLTKICTEKQEALKQQIADQRSVDRNLISTISELSTGDSDDLGLKAPSLSRRESKKDWFYMPKFYLFGVCYMSVRLYTNIFGTLLPFFLMDVLKMNGSGDDEHVSFNLALVPMIAYASSVVVSTRLNWFYTTFGRKKALFLGTALCMVCLVGMAFLTHETAWVMYIIALFIGTSQSLVLSTGINLISDVVGAKAKTGAFVFGIYSLLDKFSCGIVIFLIGNTAAYSKESKDITDSDSNFIRLTFILIPGVACLLSSLIVLSYPIEEYGKDRKKTEGFLKEKSELQQELVA